MDRVNKLTYQFKQGEQKAVLNKMAKLISTPIMIKQKVKTLSTSSLNQYNPIYNKFKRDTIQTKNETFDKLSVLDCKKSYTFVMSNLQQKNKSQRAKVISDNTSPFFKSTESMTLINQTSKIQFRKVTIEKQLIYLIFSIRLLNKIYMIQYQASMSIEQVKIKIEIQLYVLSTNKLGLTILAKMQKQKLFFEFVQAGIIAYDRGKRELSVANKISRKSLIYTSVSQSNENSTMNEINFQNYSLIFINLIMSSDSFDNLMKLLQDQNAACKTHYKQNNKAIIDLIQQLNNNMTTLSEQLQSNQNKHNHSLSKVEEAENEDQDQSRQIKNIHTLEAEEEDYQEQYIKQNDDEEQVNQREELYSQNGEQNELEDKQE